MLSNEMQLIYYWLIIVWCLKRKQTKCFTIEGKTISLPLFLHSFHQPRRSMECLFGFSMYFYIYLYRINAVVVVAILIWFLFKLHQFKCLRNYFNSEHLFYFVDRKTENRWKLNESTQLSEARQREKNTDQIEYNQYIKVGPHLYFMASTKAKSFRWRRRKKTTK